LAGQFTKLNRQVPLTAAVAAPVQAAVEGIGIAAVCIGAVRCSTSWTKAEVIEVCRVVLEELILFSVIVPNRPMPTKSFSMSSVQQKRWDETHQPLIE
jgi:hypothetical protein